MFTQGLPLVVGWLGEGTNHKTSLLTKEIRLSLRLMMMNDTTLTLGSGFLTDPKDLCSLPPVEEEIH